MPNHVTTLCRVSGNHATVLDFREKHITKGKDEDSGKEWENFDFQTIIPKPDILNKTTSGSGEILGLAALVGDVVHTDFTFSTRFLNGFKLHGAPIGHAEQVRAWLAQHRPEILEAGRLAARAIAETGYPDWYHWSIANWGTKWDAYEYAEKSSGSGFFVFKFDTAWSFPEPIFEKLSALYPELRFEIESVDEGGPEYAGHYAGKDQSFDSVPESRERRLRVYGYDPNENDDS
jgi:hypothetical protein